MSASEIRYRCRGWPIVPGATVRSHSVAPVGGCGAGGSVSQGSLRFALGFIPPPLRGSIPPALRGSVSPSETVLGYRAVLCFRVDDGSIPR